MPRAKDLNEIDARKVGALVRTYDRKLDELWNDLMGDVGMYLHIEDDDEIERIIQEFL